MREMFQLGPAQDFATVLNDSEGGGDSVTPQTENDRTATDGEKEMQLTGVPVKNLL